MNKKKVSVIILIITLLIVLYLTLKDDFNGITNSIKYSNKLILMFGLFVFLCYLFIKSLSLLIFIKERKKNFSLKKAYMLTIISQFLNGITPFQTGGQPFSIYLLKKEGIRVSDSTKAMIKDSVSYQIALMLIGILSLLINYKYGVINDKKTLSILIAFGFLVNLTVLIVLIMILTAKKAGKKVIGKIIDFIYRFKIINKHVDKDSLLESLNNFYETGNDMRKNKLNIFIGILLNFLALFVLYTIPYVVILSLGLKAGIIRSVVATSFVMIVGNFVPIPGASGGIEYAYIRFFDSLIKNPILGSSMLLWRFITYIFGMLSGFIILVFHIKGSYFSYDEKRKE